QNSHKTHMNLRRLVSRVCGNEILYRETGHPAQRPRRRHTFGRRPARKGTAMEIYVIRHADAEPLSETVTDDAERPLTETGKGQAKAVGQCLQKLGAKVDVILTSPLLRARQTAEGIVAAWTKPAPAVEVVDELVDAGKRRKLTKVISAVGKETVAIV